MLIILRLNKSYFFLFFYPFLTHCRTLNLKKNKPIDIIITNKNTEGYNIISPDALAHVRFRCGTFKQRAGNIPLSIVLFER